jgi:transcriptional regulator with XRE-family HTH domain
MVRQQPALLPEADDGTDRINQYVCRRLKTQRILHSMSQERLATALGISYQQLQRYESAKSRLPSSMLYRAALALGVPVGYFFDDITEDCGDVADRSPDKSALVAVRNLQRIPDGETRQSLVRLIDELAHQPRSGKSS